VSYTTAEGRQQVLDTLAKAVDQLALALADLGEAYEQLDESSADELERALFRPVRTAYARARRTHAEFAQRHGLPARAFEAAVRGAPSHGARGFVDDAVASVAAVDAELAELQDSMLPVEVGDPELRAGLEAVRTLLAGVGAGARDLTRTLGR
jgi:hypothetical protein